MNDMNVNNWLTAPINKRSFQNVESLFDTIRIKRSSEVPSEIPLNLRSLDSIEIQNIEGQTKSFKDMIASTHTDSFLVLKNGEIIFEEYFNEMNPESLHLMNSITKSFMGMLVGILADKGVFDIKEKVTKYVPELNDTGFSETTIQSALDMSAAVKFEEDYDEPFCDFWKEAAVVGWRPDLVDDNSPKTLLDFALSLKEKEQEEIEGYHYRSVLTTVLAMVIERATDERVQDLLEKHIWQKLKTEQDAVLVVDKTGLPFAGAGMNASTRDLARFGQMIVNRGMFGNERVVSEDWIVKTLAGTDKARQNFEVTEYTPLIPGGHYMNQFWASSNSEILSCVGIHGQGIYMNMANKTVAVKFSSHPDPDDGPLFIETFTALDALTRSI